MASERERFFALASFALVGNSDLRPFPGAFYAELRDMGRKVYAVDQSGTRYIQGDEAFASLSDLPEKIEAVIIDLPRHKTRAVVQEMVDLGIDHLWLQSDETPEVLQVCKEHGVAVHCGNGRVYTQQGFSFGRLLLKLVGRY